MYDDKEDGSSEIINILRTKDLENISAWYYDDGFGTFHHRYIYQLVINGELLYSIEDSNKTIKKMSTRANSYEEAAFILRFSCFIKILISYLILWEVILKKKQKS